MNQTFFAGTRKGLFTFKKEGSQWNQSQADFLGAQVPIVFFDQRDNTLYAAVEHGHFGTKLHRRKKGESWEELDPPTYPEKPADAPEILDPYRQVPVPWSLEKIWSLESAGDDRPGKLWCGTIPGGLFYSDNFGESWELNNELWEKPERKHWMGGGYDFPGIHSICVDPRDSGRIAVGISCGGVWISKDGGKSWEQGAEGMSYDFQPEDQGGADPESQDPHLMVQCKGFPDAFWVQHHCGIYRSNTGGKGWTSIENVSPSAFGFAAAVHPANPETAWFVPATKDEDRYPVDGKFIVTRTRDGGKTFESLSDGLPTPPAYDLVYRHGLVVSPDGNQLVMGSTTGSIWSSDNQGDTWQSITNHLPPVYCVKFG